jgi:hypothetical protein
LPTTLVRPPSRPATHVLLERSRAGLLQAVAARTPAERYVTAHLAALRAAAAVLAARGRPSPRGGPRSVWEVLPRIAPELTEWAAFFAATASRRAAVEAGRGETVTARAAGRPPPGHRGLPPPRRVLPRAAVPAGAARGDPALRVSPPFTHLHVASGYSLRYGASTPAALVEVAAAHGMSALALTDRDGLYGAVKFAAACQSAGLAPLLGVDLAIEPTPVRARPAVPLPRRTPVRGGSSVDPRHPRVTVLALGQDGAAACRPARGGGGCAAWSRPPTCGVSAGFRSATST